MTLYRKLEQGRKKKQITFASAITKISFTYSVTELLLLLNSKLDSHEACLILYAILHYLTSCTVIKLLDGKTEYKYFGKGHCY